MLAVVSGLPSISYQNCKPGYPRGFERVACDIQAGGSRVRRLLRSCGRPKQQRKPGGRTGDRPEAMIGVQTTGAVGQDQGLPTYLVNDPTRREQTTAIAERRIARRNVAADQLDFLPTASDQPVELVEDLQLLDARTVLARPDHICRSARLGAQPRGH